MRVKPVLLYIVLMLLLFSSCQAGIGEGELTAFTEQAQLVEDSIEGGFRLTEGLLADYSQFKISGELAKEQVRQLREAVRSKRNEMLLLSVPNQLHRLKLDFLDAADQAGLALQYAAIFAETGDTAMFASWLTTRELAEAKLRSARSKLNRMYSR